MTIVDPSSLQPVGLISDPQIQNAINAIVSNLAKLNSFGLGVYSPLLKPLHPTSSLTLDPQVNGQWQSVGVRSSVAGITITLPAFSKLVDGSYFIIFDETLNSDTYTITIDPNGNKINGDTSDKTINVAGGFVVLYCFSVGITESEFIILGSSGLS